MHKSLIGTAVATVLAATVGITAPAGSADTSPFTINVILSLTGQGAFVGNAQHNTLAALENGENKRGGIQGHPIHFTFKDDQTNPQVAVQAVNAVIADRVAVLLSPNIAVTCRAAAPLVVNGPVTYCSRRRHRRLRAAISSP